MLEDYRDRIGGPQALVDASLPHDVSFFDEVIDRHTKTIRFDNLDVALGRGVDISPDAIRRKMLDEKRGGFCFEHAELVHQALEELGVEHHRFLARVLLGGSKKPGAATHCGNIAVIDGERYLIDPGFGGGTPTAAIPFNGEERAGFRMVPAAGDDSRAVDCILQSRTEPSEKYPDGWKDVYGICGWKPQQADLEMACWFAATHRSQPFTQNLVLVRREDDGEAGEEGTPGGTRSISNNRLKTPRGTTELTGPDDLRSAMHLYFQADVGLQDTAMLWGLSHRD